MRHVYLNRTLCDVLQEMRTCCKTGNYSYLPGLISEAQYMGNLMESALDYQREARSYREEAKDALEELNKIKKKIANEQ